MTIDFSNLQVDNADQLAAVLEQQLGATATDWWNANKTVVPGYLRSLAEATIQTRTALANHQITPEAADMILHNQELAFNQTIQFTKFMTLALGQTLLNTVFQVVGWVIYNKTGVNIAPNLVQPTTPAAS
ncbi:hypothetical protein [Caulobacter endophyticus]|uniref:Uncharacterized protein n=1 Tax=Caulobacter endophyticus TaxID=2172652 RepID=A0A2T9K0R4_9CAUL|nr:hypothetical protein [Caulobacter endophyticus]PVM89549.1 hypothetical protein DDF67_12075 [Caulobacter endophyticus]